MYENNNNVSFEFAAQSIAVIITINLPRLLIVKVQRNFSVNLPIVLIYFYFDQKKFKSYYQENIENNV